MDSPSKLVTITAKSTAVSATPVRPGKTYPLSVLDHAMAKHKLCLVFYFRSPIDRDRLKESLSDVLSHYPAVTGRVGREKEGNFVVRCNDAGVRVLEATVAVEVEEWLRGGGGEERELVYWEDMAEDASIWSPFCVQISDFKNGGFAIGLTCPHMYSDPTCAILLIKAWADAHRRACIINPPFFHPPGLKGRPRPNTDTVSATILENKSKLPRPAPAKMSTVTFRFDGASVRRCLAETKQSSPEATPFDALAALCWWRIGSDSMEICIDFRKRMHAPLPHGFFGNALHFSSVAVAIDGECRGNDTWGKLAEKVRMHIAGLEEEEYWSAIDWFEGRRDKKTGKYGEAFQMYGPTLSCLMLDHVFAYETMFDDKGPAHVSCSIDSHVDGEGMVLVMPHPDDKDGRTVAITLPSDRTDQICRDEVILRMGPTFVLRHDI